MSIIPALALLMAFVGILSELLRNPRTRGLTVMALIVLGGGTLFYHSAEGWSWLDSLYFCVVTLATIGYGDLAPKTDLGKAFTILYIIVGFGIVASFIRLVAQREVSLQGLTHRHVDVLEDDDKPEHKDVGLVVQHSSLTAKG